MARKIKVLVVDDSAFARQTITRYIQAIPTMEVVGKANNGLSAIEMVLKMQPDLITLDLDMPNLNGFGFLRWLMEESPTPVLIVSSIRSNRNVFKALEMGAIDFVEKPSREQSLHSQELEREFRRKILLISALKRNDLQKYRKTNMTLNETLLKRQIRDKTDYDNGVTVPQSLIAIGASTGGPPALHHLISNLDKNTGCPIIICQHMPSGFTRLFADRMNKSSALMVKEAENDELLKSGTVYVSPGGYHVELHKMGGAVAIKLFERKEKDKYVPSIDRLMETAARIFKTHCLGIVLTGMGDDGSIGIKKIRELGGQTIAQSEDSSVVFGMPSKAIKTGAILEVLDLDSILQNMVQFASIFALKSETEHNKE